MNFRINPDFRRHYHHSLLVRSSKENKLKPSFECPCPLAIRGWCSVEKICSAERVDGEITMHAEDLAWTILLMTIYFPSASWKTVD